MIPLRLLKERPRVLPCLLSAILLLAGYAALAAGPTDGVLSMTVAPLLLATAYCGSIPWAVMTRPQPL